MCDIATRIAKLCRAGGEIEFELAQALTDVRALGSDYPRVLQRARALLQAQGDPWASAFFERLLLLASRHRGTFGQLAEITGESPAESVEEALKRAQEVLV